MAKVDSDLIEPLRHLLLGREASTQEEIGAALEKQRYEVNQSTVQFSQNSIKSFVFIKEYQAKEGEIIDLYSLN